MLKFNDFFLSIFLLDVSVSFPPFSLATCFFTSTMSEMALNPQIVISSKHLSSDPFLAFFLTSSLGLQTFMPFWLMFQNLYRLILSYRYKLYFLHSFTVLRIILLVRLSYIENLFFHKIHKNLVTSSNTQMSNLNFLLKRAFFMNR